MVSAMYSMLSAGDSSLHGVLIATDAALTTRPSLPAGAVGDIATLRRIRVVTVSSLAELQRVVGVDLLRASPAPVVVGVCSLSDIIEGMDDTHRQYTVSAVAGLIRAVCAPRHPSFTMLLAISSRDARFRVVNVLRRHCQIIVRVTQGVQNSVDVDVEPFIGEAQAPAVITAQCIVETGRKIRWVSVDQGLQ